MCFRAVFCGLLLVQFSDEVLLCVFKLLLDRPTDMTKQEGYIACSSGYKKKKRKELVHLYCTIYVYHLLTTEPSV